MSNTEKDSVVGRRITAEQAEICMKEDDRFEMRGNSFGFYFFHNGKYVYRSPNNTWSAAVATTYNYGRDGWNKRCEIATDPNGTFLRRFPENMEIETREEAIKWLVEHKWQILLVTEFSGRKCEVYWNGSSFSYRSVNDIEWKSNYSFALSDKFKEYQPNTTPSTAKTEEE